MATPALCAVYWGTVSEGAPSVGAVSFTHIVRLLFVVVTRLLRHIRIPCGLKSYRDVHIHVIYFSFLLGGCRAAFPDLLNRKFGEAKAHDRSYLCLDRKAAYISPDVFFATGVATRCCGRSSR